MINLLIRRTVAFGIDFVLLATLISVPCLTCLLAQKNLPPTLNLFFLAGVLLYFTISESSGSGQSLGKRLLQIRLQTQTGEKVSLYQSCARISLILLVPEIPRVLKPFLVAVHLISSPGILLPILFWLSSWIVWPVSILIGLNSVGLHDFMLDTQVLHTSQKHQVFHVTKTRRYPWIVIITTIGISLLFAYLLSHPVDRAIRDTLNSMNRSEKLECERLKRISRDLPLRIKNGPKYILGSGTFSFNQWDLLKLPDTEINFSKSFSEEINIDDRRFDTYVHYRIFVTPSGIWSCEFQKDTIEYIFSKAKRPGLLMTIQFVNKTTALVFLQTIKKRYIGYLQTETRSEKEKHELVVLEPEAVVKHVGISWSLLIREDL